jgi:undecaprenyl-diphosphatase
MRGKALRKLRSLARLPVEPRLMLMIGALAGLALLFAKIVEDVVNHESHAFDRSVLLALRTAGDPSMPIGPAWLRDAAIDITSLGSPTIIALLTIIATVYLFLARSFRSGIIVALSIGLGAIFERSLKLAFDRPRPDIVPHFVIVTSPSFPSGHATLSAITYLTIGALIARSEPAARMRVFVLAVSVVATLLVGLSRVYLGVHWPTDVLAGWTIGAAWALMTWLITRLARTTDATAR